MRAALEPRPQLRRGLPHAVLHVDFLRLVARKGQVDSGQLALGEKPLPFAAVEIVRGFVLVAEKEPVAAGRAGGDALLHEGAEGRDARAGADHDDVLRRVGRQAEVRLGHEHRDERLAARHAVGEEGRADAVAAAEVGLVAHGRDGEVHLPGERPGRGGDGVEPRHQALEMADKFLRRELGAGEFLQQVDEFALTEENLQGLLGAGGEQLGELRLLLRVGGLRGEGLENLFRRFGEGELGVQRLAEADRGGHPRQGHRLVAGGAEQLDHLLDELRAVGGEDAKRVAHGVGEAAAGDIDDEVADVLARPVLVEHAVFQQLGGKRIVLGVEIGGRRCGGHGHGLERCGMNKPASSATPVASQDAASPWSVCPLFNANSDANGRRGLPGAG